MNIMAFAYDSDKQNYLRRYIAYKSMDMRRYYYAMVSKSAYLF